MATTALTGQARKPKPRRPIAADKARGVLGGLINKAGNGKERVVLTRHGLPAAAIVSIDDLNTLEATDAA